MMFSTCVADIQESLYFNREGSIRLSFGDINKKTTQKSVKIYESRIGHLLQIYTDPPLYIFNLVKDEYSISLDFSSKFVISQKLLGFSQQWNFPILECVTSASKGFQLTIHLSKHYISICFGWCKTNKQYQE